jgi:hypothetical protein
MFEEAFYPKTKSVLKLIKDTDILRKFYLAGGTGLAIQLGHRKSIDLDFFTQKFPNHDLLIQSLTPYNPQIISQSKGTLDTIIKDVKVSFLKYKYPLIKETKRYKHVKVASVEDIACMKLTAIASRGSKKDFVDLYEVLQDISLKNLLILFEQKYKDVDYSKAHILKSLSYFADAKDDPNPKFIKDRDWLEIKKSLKEVSAKIKF